MLQIVYMVLGIVYLARWVGLNRACSEMAGRGFDSSAVAEWRTLRVRQYAWGLVAGWGSFIIYFIVAKATLDPDGYYTYDEALSASMPAILTSLVVLIAGIVISVKAGHRASAMERKSPVAP